MGKNSCQTYVNIGLLLLLLSTTCWKKQYFI